MDICAAVWSESDLANIATAPGGAPEGMAESGVNDVLCAHQPQRHDRGLGQPDAAARRRAVRRPGTVARRLCWPVPGDRCRHGMGRRRRLDDLQRPRPAGPRDRGESRHGWRRRRRGERRDGAGGNSQRTEADREYRGNRRNVGQLSVTSAGPYGDASGHTGVNVLYDATTLQTSGTLEVSVSGFVSLNVVQPTGMLNKIIRI